MEEYFVYHGRDRGGPLREALAEILTRPTLRVHVLLGIRDDALAELDAFKGRVPGLFGNVLRLDHLDVDAARAAIVEPLAELEAIGGPHVVAEPALVAAVVDQVASGRIERRLAGRGIVEGSGRRGRVEAPYLQLVMERLWEVERGRGSSVLRAETLAELGGAGRIVQQHLERALASLDEPERELVARLFHQLVTPSGTKIAHGGRRSQPLRRRVPRAPRGRAPRALGRARRPCAPRPERRRRRATRSTTTFSPEPFSTGVRATRRNARSPRSARRRGGGTGGWRRSSASARWRWP